MNAREFLIRSYFLVGILIGIAYISSIASSWAIHRFGISMKRLHHLRISQFLILSAIIAGSIAPCLPGSILPNLRAWVFSQIRPATSGLVGGDQDYDSSRRLSSNLRTRYSEALETSETNDRKPKPTSYTIEGGLMAILIAGSIFTLGRTLWRIFFLYRVISQATLLRKSGCVAILVSDQMGIPFSTRAFLKAHVVVPIQLLNTRKDLNIAIQHEIQHHRSGDTLWIILMEVLVILFFWNPVLYLWRIKFEELQEFACDESLIIRGKVTTLEYGSCLIEVAQSWVASQRTLFGAAGMASSSLNPNTTQSFLKRRVEMLFTYQKSLNGWKKALVLGGVSTATLLIAAAIVGGKSEANGALHSIAVNTDVQKIANHALAEGVKKSKAEDGYAVVSDPMTGSILALAYYDGTTQQSVDVKKAAELILSKVYAPNSLVKPLIVASALDRKKISLSEKFNCEKGLYRVAGKEYHDHEAFGDLTPAEVIFTSSDIGMIKISEKVGKEGLTQTVKDFGFGNEGTSTYLPGAAKGHAPTLIDQQSIAQVVTDFYIGKNTYTTPIELVQAYGAIVNGGKLLKPRAFQNEASNPGVIRQVISSETSETMKRILAEVVTKGTGQKAKSALYSTAGKTATGSAYTSTPQGSVYNQELGVAQFIGSAPATMPKVLVYVVIDKPEGSCYGGTHAAPVFAQIAEKTLKYLGVKPDRI